MIKLNLSKKGLDETKAIAQKVVDKLNAPKKSQVVAVFDISGSMEFPENRFYTSGIMDALATRVLGLGLTLDDDGIIPVYTIGSGTHKLAPLTKDNLQNYIKDKVASLRPEGTEYAPAIEAIVRDAQEGDPMLVLLFTDGDNSDHAAAKRSIIEASNLPIFFQWYGIFRGKSQPGFEFLEKLDTLKGRVVDNCGFSPLGLDITNSNLNSTNDEEKLYEDMLKEYKDFPKKATDAGVTWANKGQVAQPAPERRKIFGIF